MTTTGVRDIPDTEYHKHPALSFSGAKLLLPPNCPAIYKWQRDNPRPTKRAWDFGHLVHALVLGAGPRIVPIDTDDWRTKDARAQRDEAHAAGEIPVLASEYAAALKMVDAVNAHPIASRLFAPGTGKPEAALFWTDEESGVPLRGRLDWLPNVVPGRRMVIPDLKTAGSADPETFAKSAANYGYAQQDAFYRDGVKALGLDSDPAFVFVVIEKNPPYLISVVELDTEAVRIGRALNRRAIEIFKECTATDTWPGYTADVELVSLPLWYQRQHEDITEMSI